MLFVWVTFYDILNNIFTFTQVRLLAYTWYLLLTRMQTSSHNIVCVLCFCSDHDRNPGNPKHLPVWVRGVPVQRFKRCGICSLRRRAEPRCVWSFLLLRICTTKSTLSRPSLVDIVFTVNISLFNNEILHKQFIQQLQMYNGNPNNVYRLQYLSIIYKVVQMQLYNKQLLNTWFTQHLIVC